MVNLKIVDVGVNDPQQKIIKRFKYPNIINDYTSLYNRINFQKNALKKNPISINNLKSFDNEIKTNNKRKKLNGNSSLLNKNNLLLLKSELNKSDEFIATKKLFNSNSVDNINILKYNDKNSSLNLKLPPIIKKFNFNQKNKKNITLKKINPLLNSIKENEKKNLNNILYNKCHNCFINKISIYCRLCDTFLCNNCALNKKSVHQEHKDYFIKLDKNTNPENVNKYQALIISDFNNSLDYFNNLDKNTNKNAEINLEKFYYEKFIENLDENVEKLVRKVNDMKSSIKILDVNEKVKESEKTVKEICAEEKTNLKKFNVYGYNNQIEPFLELNKFEKDMSKYFNNYEASIDQRIYIKSQIELLFDNVENEIDGVMDDIEKIFANINK